MLKFIKYIPILLFAFQLNAQKGEVHANVNYGIPHLYKNIVKIATRSDAFRSAFNGTLEVSKITGLNPVALKAEYGITDHFFLGVSICSWNMKLSVIDYYNVQQAGNVLGRDEIDIYKFKISSTSFGIRPNFQWEINGWGRIFVGTAIGVTNNKLSVDFSSTDAGKTFPNLKYSLSLPGGLYLAPSIGYRNMVNEFLYLNAELGYEKGAILQLGIGVHFDTVKK